MLLVLLVCNSHTTTLSINNKFMRFLIHMSKIWIYLLSHVQPAGWPILGDETFSVGHYVQTFLPNFVIPAMLIVTIDFCHVILLPLILTLAAGHKVNLRGNLSALFSRTLFN